MIEFDRFLYMGYKDVVEMRFPDPSSV